MPLKGKDLSFAPDTIQGSSKTPTQLPFRERGLSTQSSGPSTEASSPTKYTSISTREILISFRDARAPAFCLSPDAGGCETRAGPGYPREPGLDDMEAAFGEPMLSLHGTDDSDMDLLRELAGPTRLYG
jgi:hypothetical protein